MPAQTLARPGYSPLSFAELRGFAGDDHAEAFAAFQRSSSAIVERRAALRKAIAPSAALIEICRRAIALGCVGSDKARAFFEANFRPFRVLDPQDAALPGFFTGYYEPIVNGSLTPSVAFAAPILAPPQTSSAHSPLPERAAIEAGALHGAASPIVWLRDPAEVFLIQVQGSGRVRLEDGRTLRLVYAGRNGWPYTSIGRILIERGAIVPEAMSLAALKGWVRDHGQQPGEQGAELMRRNQSYVFFKLALELPVETGPIGGEGLSLTPLRSLAVDRGAYPYGTPVWIDVDMREAIPEGRLRRLMIAQDTGSAIVGQARADIFFGSGDAAGACAGNVRHAGEFIVFLPVEEGSLR